MNIDSRYPVTASLFMFREMKRRHEQVHRGHELLKRKAEALRFRSRQAAADLCETADNVIPSLREAYICLAAAKFSNGEYNPNAMILENLGQAQVRVVQVLENISGVTTTSLVVEEGNKMADPLRLAGLAVGGHRLGEAKKAFRHALLQLIKLASLRSTCVLLDEAMRTTMRKVNGISKVIIPKLINTEKYIVMEMDERVRFSTVEWYNKISANIQEREEFHRLKMVKAKKLRDQSLDKILRRKEKAERGSNIGDYRGRDTISVQQVSEFHANERLMSLLNPGSSRSTHIANSRRQHIGMPLCFPHFWNDEDLLF